MRPAVVDAASIRDWLTAIGTAEAAILALYIGVILEHLRRPQLSLLFDRGTSDTALVRSFHEYLDDEGEFVDHEEFDIAYLRLRVRNRTGRVAAEDVEVTITGAHELHLDGPQILRLDGLLSNSAPPATRMHVYARR